MPFALIPDGYSLEKVTKAQEQALKELRKHESTKTFLGSPQAGTAIGGVALSATILIFLIPIIKNIFTKLGEDDATKSKTMGQILEEQARDPTGPTGFTTLLTGALIGVPETLTGVIIPAPVQAEIERQTGVDIGGLFGRLRGTL